MPDSAFPVPAELFAKEMDLAVIGAGMAGLAAGVFAVNRGLAVARLGSTGDIAYTTGYLDILGIPLAGCDPCTDPRAGLAELDQTDFTLLNAEMTKITAIEDEVVGLEERWLELSEQLDA